MNQYYIIYLSRFLVSSHSHIQWSRLLCVDTFLACALFAMWKIEQQSHVHVEWAWLKLFENWIFNSWVIWEYFNWAQARQSCLYLMGSFPRCECAAWARAHFGNHAKHVPCAYDSIFDWIQWTPSEFVFVFAYANSQNPLARSLARFLSAPQLYLFRSRVRIALFR